MSVIVKGMEMPKSCTECVINHSFFRMLKCSELKGMKGFKKLANGYDWAISWDMRKEEYKMIDLAEVEKKELEDTIALLASRRAFAGEYFGENTGYIRALDIAAAAVLRQYAKKPQAAYDEKHIEHMLCPACSNAIRKPVDKIVYNGRRLTRKGNEYCPDCGQRIDWGEEE